MILQYGFCIMTLWMVFDISCLALREIIRTVDMNPQWR